MKSKIHIFNFHDHPFVVTKFGQALQNINIQKQYPGNDQSIRVGCMPYLCILIYLYVYCICGVNIGDTGIAVSTELY